MWEILMMRRVSGRWRWNAGVSCEMQETWQVSVWLPDSENPRLVQTFSADLFACKDEGHYYN